jgi:ribose/xylose/arabinose/galactoside ABC-type transport system permease subunit
LAGGRGGIFGTLVGTLIIGILYNILNLKNVSAFWQYILVGTVIIAAAVINETSKRYKKA